MSGAPNSISTYDGKVAVALEDAVNKTMGKLHYTKPKIIL